MREELSAVELRTALAAAIAHGAPDARTLRLLHVGFARTVALLGARGTLPPAGVKVRGTRFHAAHY